MRDRATNRQTDRDLADRQTDRETDKQTDRQSDPHSTSTSKLREKRRFPLTSIVKICSEKQERQIQGVEKSERGTERVRSAREVCVWLCVYDKLQV